MPSIKVPFLYGTMPSNNSLCSALVNIKVLMIFLVISVSANTSFNYSSNLNRSSWALSLRDFSRNVLG